MNALTEENADFDIPESLVETEKDTIYLSGPIRKADDNGHGWRDELVEQYEDEFDFINPLDRYDPERQEVLNDPINIDEESDKEQILPSEYVTDDKIGIQRAEYVFVGLPEIIARGTMMETMLAYLQNTPFFVWTMDGQEESGWLFHHSEVMYDDKDEIIDYIRNYE